MTAPAWRLLLALAAVTACGGEPSESAPTYVGAPTCAGCHTTTYAAWQGSVHARALRPADAPGVQTAFDATERRFASLTFTPRQRADERTIEVRAEDEDGSARAHRAAYVLGAHDIEQLVVDVDGALHALPVGWDTETHEWFDVFPEAPRPSDWAHWLAPGMNATGQCLECHVTGFEKGYDPATQRYASTWREAGVACEACHGPGSAHVADARSRRTGLAPYGETHAAGPMAPCAFCHSRRVLLTEPYVPGQPLADAMDFELLDGTLFHADGSSADEAYEWTSFRMSRMAQEGVRCRDCHEPHAGGLRASGNALCLSCHDQALATEAHIHHPAGSPGAECVGCHMPPLVLMERDVRRDHRLSIPDPARAAAIGAPDACTTCHTSESQRWAAQWIARWYGTSAVMERERVLAAVFEGGRRGDARAVAGLTAALQDPTLDAPRRASAARLLEPWARAPDVAGALRDAAHATDPWLRASAVRSLGATQPAPGNALGPLAAATSDPARVVRLEAAFALRGADVAALDPDRRRPVDAAFAEWLSANAVLADLPESHFNRGLFLGARGDAPGAMAAYRAAIRLWPWDMAPRHNLAMTLEGEGDSAGARRELLAALERDPDFVPAHFDLARLWAAEQAWEQATAALERCLAAAPSYPRAAYTLALIHQQRGEHARAFDALERATGDPASRTEALRELVRLAHQVGDTARRDRWLPAAILADPAVGTDPRVRAALAGGS